MISINVNYWNCRDAKRLQINQQLIANIGPIQVRDCLTGNGARFNHKANWIRLGHAHPDQFTARLVLAVFF